MANVRRGRGSREGGRSQATNQTSFARGSLVTLTPGDNNITVNTNINIKTNMSTFIVRPINCDPNLIK